ncbi:MAG: glucose 1-dehydrogenase [Actinomycetota bacterium]|nr:glucose 1-dehydrogenase [Actinomycetota bacterium]
MAGRVAGKVSIVTGGASGIGRACSMLLTAEGSTVVVTDIQDEAGAAVVAEIQAAGGSASYLHHDVTSEDEWKAVATSVMEAHGRIDVLVNNAGIGIGGSVLDFELSDWQRQMAINVDGVFLGMKHCIPGMRDTGGGSIINMSSVAGLKGSPRLAGYHASKGAVRLMTKSVALECARERWNVRVNSVHPGIIETPIWDTVGAALTRSENASIDVDSMAQVAVPTGVLGQPTDIANGVLFLASDDSIYMTGSEVVIDAGMSC